MTDSMRTAVREIDELTFRKNSSVVKEILSMFAGKAPTIQEENEEDSKRE
jgi:hypothetical protein